MRPLRLSFASAVIGCVGACVPELPVDQRPCPCADGYVCCDEVCVAESEGCSAGDGDGGSSTPECEDREDCPTPAKQDCDDESQSCVELETWSVVTMSFTGSDETTADLTLDRILFSDFTLTLGQTHSLARFQQNLDGLTVWSLYVDNASSEGETNLAPSGESTYIFVSVNAADVPQALRGSYFGNQTQTGTIDFRELDLSAGGVVEVGIDVALEGGNGEVPATLRITGEARIEIPQ